MFRILKKGLLWILAATALLALLSYLVIKNQWRQYYTGQDIQTFADTIEASPTLSTTFYGIYDRLYPGDRFRSMTQVYSRLAFYGLIGKHKRNTSYHVLAARHYPNKTYGAHAAFTLAWGLERYVSSSKCFDFVMLHENQSMQRIDSTVTNLRSTQDTSAILEYLIIRDRPSYYRHYPDALRKKTEELLMRLKGAM